MITVRYLDGKIEKTIKAAKGEVLLKVLQSHQINVYGSISNKLNCGGRGICATCGVYIVSESVNPIHWHDQLADKFGYPRLSCQIRLENDMTIRKPERKVIWGQFLPKMK